MTRQFGTFHLTDAFDKPPVKPLVRQFTLVPNMQPAVIGRYSFQMRTTYPETSRTQHKVTVALTRLESGQDHCRVEWEHKKAGAPATATAIPILVTFTALLDPGRGANPYGPILFTHGSYDAEAPWATPKGKARRGNQFFTDVSPTYRVGLDHPEVDAAEIREAASKFAETLRAIAARNR